MLMRSFPFMATHLFCEGLTTASLMFPAFPLPVDGGKNGGCSYKSLDFSGGKTLAFARTCHSSRAFVMCDFRVLSVDCVTQNKLKLE